MTGRFEIQAWARRGQPSTFCLTAGLLAVVLSVGLSAQAPLPKPPAAATPKTLVKPASLAPSVETVIALVNGGMSEPMVIDTIKDEGKAYKLAAADLLKLQKAGVSEAIIAAMKNPTGATTAAAPTAPATAKSPTAATRSTPEPAGPATAYPPDLPDVVSATRKRMLTVDPFDYSTVRSWVSYWFNTDMNIGEGIRSMLTTRLQQSKSIRLLERHSEEKVLREQDRAQSDRYKKGTGAKTGQMLGADVMLLGDIVIFGRDDTTKHKGLGAVLGTFSPVAGGLATMNKEEKAVVGINLRLVEAETGEVIETAEARGESSRKSKDYAGVLGVKGAGGAAGTSMNSSNFQQTIIGEATSDAVTKIVSYLETKIPQLPAKPREMEGRVAQLTSTGAYLTLGSDDGVVRGDRFEILKINEDIKDPVTKQVIAQDTVKVGELVVDTVNAASSSGRYGGQALSPAQVSGKGYVAKLVTK